jgi:LPXTG-site transpeptidase (sortase) family protein
VENEIITYTLRVDNFGPNDATGVNLTDILPTGITFVSSNATQGTYTPGSGLWAIGGLSNGSVVTLTLSASVNPNTRGATIINAVSALSADQEDPFQSNNTASVSFTVATTRLIGIVTDASTDEPLEDVTVRLTDSAQTGYTTQTNASGWYTFTSTLVNPIAAGSANVFVELEGYADANLTPNLIAGQDNRLDIPLDTADLVVTLTDGKTTMLPGEVLTYTLTVANTGSITATNVIITDVFDTRQEFITHTLEITYSEDSATTFVWNLEDDIPPDDQISFEIAVKVDDALPSRTYAMTNQAMAATDAPEADLSDNMKLDTDTGTGTPSLTISKSVSPSSVETNEDATYRIRVENTGNVPVTDVLIYDTFSTYFDLRSATTNIGTVTRNNSTRRVDVSIDVLEPDDEVDIRVVARVNTTARSNQTVSNQADMEYTFGGIEYTRRSGTASVRIIATSTLPGTGGIELSPPKERRSRAPVIAAGLSALILGLLGAGALGYALRARKSEWSGWAARMGVVFLSAGLLFGLVSMVLNSRLSMTRAGSSGLTYQSWDAIEKVHPTRSPEHYTIFFPTPEASDEPETLPDFPIPTPTLPAETAPGEEEPDISPVNRVVIPVLGLDTIVKYVPYDGLSWLIAGLQQEVAWLGDTSWPGLGSNTALAGHVTTRFGGDGPFRHLYLLEPGDRITVFTEQNSYNYTVRSTAVVEETDLEVLKETPGSQITLITCTAWDEENRYYTRRLIVYADLVSVFPIDRISSR